ncbi:bifunctional acetate--CoA ligase family protein/GNAT family N-acetyltransferase [Fundidesulfovibrio soli]|uniref:bifunctional acetate--CoA ligase family protein/GNAT family N-acetyltransferase n=1 Tax=Fundidesulfovibrio soli TaxID=2922716 RepID=UPI001FAEAFDA|nr:bifunctional acetate--CoA ligase family protein/GNAT family N-acetyltransferase [Fundidesulfovibrio soli]
MSVANLEGLFKPTSVAVVGATNEEGHVGRVVMENLLGGAFLGPVMPLSPDEDKILGVDAYKSVDTLPLTPDLAIICTPPDTAPEYLYRLGRRGVKAAVALCPGYTRLSAGEKWEIQEKMLSSAEEEGIRILGPSGLGLIIPPIGLNASLVKADPPKGRIAFVSQSASLFTGVLDWARAHRIGFSCVVSLGDRLDLEYQDLFDYLSSDPNTRSILLFIESVGDARTFMSAARAAARNKPVLVVKPGRRRGPGGEPIAKPGQGLDEVYHEAFRRAGMLRVFEIDALFDAAQTLARTQQLKGDKLAILTNGGSIGVMAADTLVEGGGKLATLSEQTSAHLRELIGPNWMRDGIVDMGLTATPDLYSQVLTALLKDKEPNAILVMHVPFASVTGDDVAQAVVQTSSKSQRPVFTCWMGHAVAESARALFNQAGIPSYATPDTAVRAFMDMANHRRTQELLMEMPADLPAGFSPDTDGAQGVVLSVLEAGRSELTEPEAKVVLASYGIPVIRSKLVKTVEEVSSAAEELGFPVALKIFSPDIPQPFDVGGVVLDIEDQEELRQAAVAIRTRARKLQLGADIQGYIVQRMGRRGAQELLIQAQVDPVFGPFLRFGQGGLAAKLSQDKAVALPPINASLARDLINRTRVAAFLRGLGGRPPANMDAICLTLIQVAQLITDIPQIIEIDLNPIFADSQGVAVLGARIRVAEAMSGGQERLAIRPYPRELEEEAVLKNGRRILIRPIRPEDEPAHYELLKRITPEDLRYRFFGVVRELSHMEMARLTQIDYEREMAFIATAPDEEGHNETLGVVRASTKPDNSQAEFAILVRSDQKGLGMGRLLMEKIIRYCRDRGTAVLSGQALLDNKGMQGLAEKVGFDVWRNTDEDIADMRLELNKR